MSSEKTGSGKTSANGNGAGSSAGNGKAHPLEPLTPRDKPSAERSAPAEPPKGAPPRTGREPSGKTVKCPACGKPAAWEGNPSRPFCSERCRLMDLGQWADGSYAIPAEKVPDKGEDEE
jgi:endogenous inhibitor of DNA gyrase (YacG/DUF329 family)